jgi:antitoxin PrlF
MARQDLSSTLTYKGQVTIPVEVRRLLGLKPGDRVTFVPEDGVVRIRPAQGIAEQTAGMLAAYRRTPPPTAQEERAAAEAAWVEDAVRRLGA